MATYILLSSLTAQGVQTLKSNPDRLREVNNDIQELGAQVVHQWATLGEYDFINVVEAPDSATIARVSVSLAARGSTKIRTLTALTIDEFLAALG
ncbi:MAG: GYD domain-containing protein [Actinobacteria bacterium]|nr:MAG: GYD domain-containing protein [Actinomycetota bacterium]TML18325.1 MAG: GYD domain-containing protein [Actinomycetota bacterium]